MSGKGGIACANPLNRRPVRALFAHRQRSDRGLGLPDRRRLQARRDRDQALRIAAAAHPGDPSRHRRRGDRPLHPGRDRAVGRRARRARRPRRGAVRQRRRRPFGARRLCRRDRAAHAEMGGGRRAAAQFARPAGPHGAPLPRAEQHAAGRCDPGRRWRLCRALDRAAVTTPRTAGRHFIPDRGFASIGYGLPGGMGAWLAAPDRPVVAISGDGGFNMTLGELETARRIGSGLTVVVVNNAASGYVKALQHVDDGRALPVGRPGRDGLRGDRPRDGLRRHPRRGPRGAGAGACGRAWKNATARP